MNSTYTLETWPLPDERPWQIGVLAGCLGMFIAGGLMFFLPSAAQVALAASIALVFASTYQMARQEIRRVREYRLYLSRMTHTQLTSTLLYQPADRKSQEIMLGVLYKREKHAASK